MNFFVEKRLWRPRRTQITAETGNNSSPYDGPRRCLAPLVAMDKNGMIFRPAHKTPRPTLRTPALLGGL